LLYNSRILWLPGFDTFNTRFSLTPCGGAGVQG
jgi:hypothetical protein